MPPLSGALNCKTKICLEEKYFIICISIIVRQIYIYIYIYIQMGRLGETFGIFYMGLGDIFIWSKKIVSP